MSQENKEIVVGSLVSVRNSTNTGCWLGLAVDQKAGKKWAERDPSIEYDPSDKQGFFLARVLGRKLSEGMLTGRRGLPEQEPRQTVTERWAYPQLNQAYVIAGPDVASIETFLEYGRTYASLGMEGVTFFLDLALIVEHLRGVKRKRSEMNLFEWQFFAMLKQVLPQ